MYKVHIAGFEAILYISYHPIDAVYNISTIRVIPTFYVIKPAYKLFLENPTQLRLYIVHKAVLWKNGIAGGIGDI